MIPHYDLSLLPVSDKESFIVEVSNKMKKKRYLTAALFIPILVSLTINSCKKDHEGEYEYFVSKDHTFSFSKSAIDGIISGLENYYPDLNGLKSYINSGIDVYKVIYNTTVDGEKIKVSGLVCTPDADGDYPVLSFQHGTITDNSTAPSENPVELNNQLVELIASMGFIIVIPDYPGFGESAQIPHPYLIKEPTVQSVVDMLRAVKETSSHSEFEGKKIKDEFYLFGYSQGGWATLATHKALELDYPGEFNLAGSFCGAGPYNIYDLFVQMLSLSEYPMPSYIGYIINAYSFYDQFTNSLPELLKEPYASNLHNYYNGTFSLGEINGQLTTTLSDLFTPEFLSGYASSPAYSTVREAMTNNSITAWNTSVPLFLGHGDADTDVSVTATELMYERMIDAGTSPNICTKTIYPGLDHGGAIVPCIRDGLLFLLDLRDN
ncbi:MAG: Secretory lipase [Bacteroidetes bacterium ADurb.Bin145]|nr:MAG: Secretory lipase [Bacteroidetes bacterium ADurb.Bin145]